jgi:hypothetical protein
VSLERWRLATREAWARRADSSKVGTAAAATADERVAAAEARATEPLEGLPATHLDANAVSEPRSGGASKTEAFEGIDGLICRAFGVGDRVAARHPRVLNVNTGSILIAKGTRHLVQFDRIELGVEIVRDINIAHLPHHLDALLLEEEELERQETAAAKAKEEAEAAAAAIADVGSPVAAAAAAAAAASASAAAAVTSNAPRVVVSAAEAAQAATASAIAAAAQAAAAAAWRGESDAAAMFDDAAGRAPETAEAVAAAAAKASAAAARGRSGTPDPASAEETASLAREHDARVFVEVANALDLKERLVSELRAMNDVAESDAANAANDAGSPGETVLEPFQRQYASTMLKVRECNAHLQNALVRLRAHRREREGDVGVSGGWRRFAPGGGASALGGDEADHRAKDGKVVGKDGKDGKVDAKDVSLHRSCASAEIVAASEYVARRRLRALASGSDAEPSECAARAIGALLAVKACTDHGADETLYREIVDRCLSSLSPQSSASAGAFEELKIQFEHLRRVVYGGGGNGVDEG